MWRYIASMVAYLKAGVKTLVSETDRLPVADQHTQPLTDAALRAAPVVVSLTATPTIDIGDVTVLNPTANPETGLAKEAKQLPDNHQVTVSNLPVTQPVSGTVELGAASLAALESVDLNAATLAALETIELGAATLAALETVDLGATTLAALESVDLNAATLAALELVGVKGADGSGIASAANPFSVTTYAVKPDTTLLQLQLDASGNLKTTATATVAAFPWDTTLTSRMLAQQPTTGYRIWIDKTTDASYIYIAEAPAAAVNTDSTFRGVRIPKILNASGKWSENTGFKFSDKTGGSWL